MQRILGLIALTAAHASASCATYVPQQRTLATPHGQTTADYSFSSNRSNQGDIRVASYRVAKPKQHDKDRLETIQVRISIPGGGGQPVMLDPSAQRLRLPDGRQISPAQVGTQSGASQLIRIEPGSARAVDLQFVLPSDLRGTSRLPEFDVVWHVIVGTELISDVTPFHNVGIYAASSRQELGEGILDDVFVVDPYPGSSPIGLPFLGW